MYNTEGEQHIIDAKKVRNTLPREILNAFKDLSKEYKSGELTREDAIIKAEAVLGRRLDAWMKQSYFRGNGEKIKLINKEKALRKIRKAKGKNGNGNGRVKVK